MSAPETKLTPDEEKHLKKISPVIHPHDSGKRRPRIFPHRSFSEEDQKILIEIRTQLEKIQDETQKRALLAEKAPLLKRLEELEKKNKNPIIARINEFLDKQDMGVVIRIEEREVRAKVLEEQRREDRKKHIKEQGLTEKSPAEVLATLLKMGFFQTNNHAIREVARTLGVKEYPQMPDPPDPRTKKIIKWLGNLWVWKILKPIIQR